MARFSVVRKQSAFTLIELMVTLVVMGIVISIALPSFKSQMSRSEADVLGQDIVFALQYARTEAIKRSAYVSLCPSMKDGEDGFKCSDDEDGWANGFIAVVDYAQNEDDEPVLTNSPANPVKTVLRVWEKQSDKAVLQINDSLDVTAASVVADDPRSFIRFTKLGTLTQTIDSARGIVINMKMKKKQTAAEGAENCEPRSARQYTVGLVGMVRLVNETCW